MRAHLCLMSSMAALALVSTDCTSAVLRVPETFGTISAALGLAANGDTVLVNDGNYLESIHVPDGVSLVSVNGSEATFILPTEVSNVLVVEAGTSPVLVRGFRLSHQQNFCPPCVDSYNANTVIEDCSIRTGGPGSWLDPGIVLRGGGIVRNCEVDHESNSEMFQSYWDNSTILVEDCVLGEWIAPQAFNGFGGSSEIVFRNNTFKPAVKMFTEVWNTDPQDFKIEFENSIFYIQAIGCQSGSSQWSVPDSVIFRNCSFTEFLPFEIPGWGCDHPNIIAEGNFVADPLFCEEEGKEWWLTPESPCIGAGVNGEDVGARLGICGVTSAPELSPKALGAGPWPNPTTVGATLVLGRQDAPGEVPVVDVLGRMVARVAVQVHGDDARYEWSGTGSDGQLVPAGVYFLAQGRQRHRVVVVR